MPCITLLYLCRYLELDQTDDKRTGRCSDAIWTSDIEAQENANVEIPTLV